MEADTKFFRQAILNRVFDGLNSLDMDIAIGGNPSVVPPSDTSLEIQYIFNRIFNQTNKTLNALAVNL